MSRFIPENAETRDFPAAAVVAYCYQSDRGPAFVAYKGRQSKPARFYAFPNEERRDANLAEFVKMETEREDWKRARREAGHGLAVGDIVYSSWGYEQTNVDFFEVIRVPSGRSAVVRKIEQEIIESAPGSMSGKTTPKPGQFEATAKEATHRAAGLHTLIGGKSARGSLSKWGGSPVGVSWYG
ncbi:MAG: hypothetical protein WC107_07800 [Patescibacteria group bacterium]|jgi:hypothetical protein